MTVQGHEYWYGPDGAEKLVNFSMDPALDIKVVAGDGRVYSKSQAECKDILLTGRGYGLRMDPYHPGFWEILYQHDIEKAQSRASSSGEEMVFPDSWW